MHLVLDKYGLSVKQDNGRLLISHGNEQQVVPWQKVTGITVSRHIKLTTAILFEAIERGIDIQLVDKRGMPVGRLWSNKFGSIARIRKQQLAFAAHAKATAWVIALLQIKLERQQQLLALLKRADHSTDEALDTGMLFLMQQAEAMEEWTDFPLEEAADSLRGLEGSSSKRYFSLINQHIPAEWQFTKRSQHPARDAFNALLNYGYGILYGMIESYAIRSGLDPSIGIWHRDEYNKPVLVYDLIEPFRPWMDYVVIFLVMQKAITPTWLEHDETGAWWCDTTTKAILVHAVHQYFDEIIVWNRKSYSRKEHIRRFIERFASSLKKSNP